MGESPEASRLLRAKLSSFQCQAHMGAQASTNGFINESKSLGTGRMHKNLKFYRHSVQINAPGTKFVSKTRSSGATLKTKTIRYQQMMFVK